MVRRSASLAVLTAALASAWPALAAPGDDLLAALGIYQEQASRTCFNGGIGVPPPCVLAMPAVPAGKVLRVDTVSCIVDLPSTAKVTDGRFVAPAQGGVGLKFETLPPLAGRARFRNFQSPVVYVPSGQPTISVDVGAVANGSLSCTVAGSLLGG